MLESERPMQSLSNVVRYAAGTMEDMKKVMDHFKDLEKVPMKDWPLNKKEEFKSMMQKLNDEAKKNIDVGKGGT